MTFERIRMKSAAAWLVAGLAMTLGLKGEMKADALEQLRDSFEARRDAGFAAWRQKPLEIAPIREPLSEGRPHYARHFSYSIVDFAIAALWNDDRVEAANEALRQYAAVYSGDRDLRNDRDSYYWAADALCRIVEFFGSDGSIAPGRLYQETEDELLEMMWLYVKEHSFTGEAEWFAAPPPGVSQPISAEWQVSRTWHVGESENHHLMKLSTLWHFSKFLQEAPAYSDRPYHDAQTAKVHYEAWTVYAREYLRQRAKKGLFIEMANGGYGAHSLKGIYNFYDFSDDERLRELAGSLLDLYYASWAQEQIDGVRGGGQSRVYNFRSGDSSLRHIMSLYLGIGGKPAVGGARATVATSGYRLPLLVMDLALDIDGRGEYEVKERRPGLALGKYFANPEYRLRTDFGGILRYSFCTPDFIMGLAMVEPRPMEEWTLISSQNRRHGVLFRGNIHARIAPICEAAEPTFNEQWGVQRKGTMIAQKLPDGYSRGAGAMRVWFSAEGLADPIERGGWAFAEAEGAYAAVRPARGGFGWAEQAGRPAGRWMVCDEAIAPVILEVARKRAFADFATFQETVLGLPLEWSGEALAYTGLHGDDFTFYADASRMPEVNGDPVDLAPEKVFDSPFIQSQWNSGIVTLVKGERELVLDFN